MQPLKFFSLPSVILTVLVILLLSPAVVDATSLNGCGSWSVVSSPNTTYSDNILLSVAATSASSVWAVGVANGRKGLADHTLIEQWNGTQWSIVASPKNGVLSGVSAISAHNVWAVGYDEGISGFQTLIEHWNGTQWSVVPSPNPIGGSDVTFNGVKALSTNNVWAVGSYADSSGVEQTLTERWNGTQWSIVPSPNLGPHYNTLYAVAGDASYDVWTVGEYSNDNYKAQTLTEHWNGTQWSIVPSPSIGTNTNELKSVTMASTSDVWAVGEYYPPQSLSQTLIEHWDGTMWSVVASPNPGSGDTELKGVTAPSPTNVWAVGYATINSTGPSETLTEHWDGTQWSIVPSPNVSNNYLDGVAKVPNTSQVWTVGFSVGGSDIQTLTEFYC